MPLPTRPPEWGMMRRPPFTIAATTATVHRYHSSMNEHATKGTQAAESGQQNATGN